MNTTAKERRKTRPWMGDMDLEKVADGWVLWQGGLASDITVLAELMEDMGWTPQDQTFTPLKACFTTSDQPVIQMPLDMVAGYLRGH